MTIGVLLHPYGEKYKAGLGEYLFSLTKALIENDAKNEYIVYIKKGNGELPHFLGCNWKVVEVGWGSLWRDIGLWFSPKADLYIFNTPVLPLIYTPGKTLVIILDFAYWYLDTKKLKYRIRSFGTLLLHRWSVKRATKLVAISEATKKDTAKLCGIVAKKIKVIHPGIRDLSNLTESRPNFDIPESYFFYVGVLKPRKNALGLVRGFVKAKLEYGIPDKLLIAGKGGGQYMESIMQEIRTANLQKDILFVGYLTDEQLAYVMKRAKAFVFPSLFEGFGMPVIEAMKCGVPVVTSNTSSLLEVGEGAAIQVNPNIPAEIADALLFMQNEEVRKRCASLGYEKAKLFTWKKCAKKFYETFIDNSNL